MLCADPMPVTVGYPTRLFSLILSHTVVPVVVSPASTIPSATWVQRLISDG